MRLPTLLWFAALLLVSESVFVPASGPTHMLRQLLRAILPETATDAFVSRLAVIGTYGLLAFALSMINLD